MILRIMMKMNKKDKFANNEYIGVDADNILIII